LPEDPESSGSAIIFEAKRVTQSLISGEGIGMWEDNRDRQEWLQEKRGGYDGYATHYQEPVLAVNCHFCLKTIYLHPTIID
jgi:hypothetical protein